VPLKVGNTGRILSDFHRSNTAARKRSASPYSSKSTPFFTIFALFQTGSEVLFTMALGLGEGWSVKSCSFEGAPPELLLKLDFKAGHRFAYPECATCGPTQPHPTR
jgi:hypothetical protein